MTEHVERTYVCDISGREIEDEWTMRTVTLQRSMSLGHTSRSEERIHIHADETSIDLNTAEPPEIDITAYVTESDEIPLIAVDYGMREVFLGGDDMPDEWRTLADRIEKEVLDA